MRRLVREAIEQVKVSEALREIPNLVKMSGASGFYRIRFGDYRIGIAVEGDESRLAWVIPKTTAPARG